MWKWKIPIISALLLVILTGAFLASCGSSSTPTQIVTNNAPLDGKTLLQSRCSECHSVYRAVSAHQTAAQWQATVDRMIRHGAQLSPQEEQVLVNYLAQTSVQ